LIINFYTKNVIGQRDKNFNTILKKVKFILFKVGLDFALILTRYSTTSLTNKINKWDPQ